MDDMNQRMVVWPVRKDDVAYWIFFGNESNELSEGCWWRKELSVEVKLAQTAFHPWKEAKGEKEEAQGRPHRQHMSHVEDSSGRPAVCLCALLAEVALWVRADEGIGLSMAQSGSQFQPCSK
ncbi:hypothetical protein LR48_Vigan01g113900 [Vigna angularis]|uniref:Uncharacterized protein n=1 Tax=Phaseolus angularis TaxID=3914 RepID=A0A0L9TN44_PHAAN|nr:hypothetical protein LR48_Vigan01g113900 [Vigna angularis]